MTLLSEYLKEHRAVAYSIATANTHYDNDGHVVLELNDEWRTESEWDDMFVKMKGD